MVWKEHTRGLTVVVWTCTEERYRVYWKYAEDGAARKEETGKAKEVYGCAERGHGR